MNFAAEEYARGICDNAAGSEIETLVDTLNALIEEGDGGIIDDAIEYRQSDDGDEDAREDNEQVEHYKIINGRMVELRDAILKREKELAEENHEEN